MATLNQERAAIIVAEKLKKRQIIEGNEVLEMVGYGPGLQKNPGKVFGSKGFREALKRLGFSVEAADLTVAKILRTGKEENQLRASQEIYKRFGAYSQPETSLTTNILIIPPDVTKKHGVRTDSLTETDSTGHPPVQSS